MSCTNPCHEQQRQAWFFVLITRESRCCGVRGMLGPPRVESGDRGEREGAESGAVQGGGGRGAGIRQVRHPTIHRSSPRLPLRGLGARVCGGSAAKIYRKNPILNFVDGELNVQRMGSGPTSQFRGEEGRVCLAWASEFEVPCSDTRGSVGWGGHPGVHWQTKTTVPCWEAKVRGPSGNDLYLGRFDNELDAARAHDRWVRVGEGEREGGAHI